MFIIQSIFNFANLAAVLLSLFGIIHVFMEIPSWLQLTVAIIGFILSSIPMAISIYAYLTMKNGRILQLKLDILKYMLGSLYDDYLYDKMVKGKGICCNNNFREPVIVQANAYYTWKNSKKPKRSKIMEIPFFPEDKLDCYLQSLSEDPSGGFKVKKHGFMVAGEKIKFSDLDQVLDNQRLCCIITTGEITVRLYFDDGIVTVINQIANTKHWAEIGEFEIKKKDFIDILCLKYMENLYPQYKAGEFVKMRRGVILLHYKGDFEFYSRFKRDSLCYTRLEDLELITCEGSTESDNKAGDGDGVFKNEDFFINAEEGLNIPIYKNIIMGNYGEVAGPIFIEFIKAFWGKEHECVYKFCSINVSCKSKIIKDLGNWQTKRFYSDYSHLRLSFGLNKIPYCDIKIPPSRRVIPFLKISEELDLKLHDSVRRTFGNYISESGDPKCKLILRNDDKRIKHSVKIHNLKGHEINKAVTDSEKRWRVMSSFYFRNKERVDEFINKEQERVSYKEILVNKNIIKPVIPKKKDHQEIMKDFEECVKVNNENCQKRVGLLKYLDERDKIRSLNSYINELDNSKTASRGDWIKIGENGINMKKLKEKITNLEIKLVNYYSSLENQYTPVDKEKVDVMKTYVVTELYDLNVQKNIDKNDKRSKDGDQNEISLVGRRKSKKISRIINSEKKKREKIKSASGGKNVTNFRAACYSNHPPSKINDRNLLKKGCKKVIKNVLDPNYFLKGSLKKIRDKKITFNRSQVRIGVKEMEVKNEMSSFYKEGEKFIHKVMEDSLGYKRIELIDDGVKELNKRLLIGSEARARERMLDKKEKLKLANKMVIEEEKLSRRKKKEKIKDYKGGSTSIETHDLLGFGFGDNMNIFGDDN